MAMGLLIIIVGGVWLSGVVNKQQTQTNKQTVKVGAILPLTGDAAQYGQTAQKSLRLAKEKMSKEKGLNIEIVYEDDKMDPKLAVSAFQKLASQGIKYVIGFGSGETLALCPLAEKEKIILMSSGSSPKITECGDYTFRNYPSDIYQGKVLSEKISQKGYKTIALLTINNEYGAGLKREFEKNYQGTIPFSEMHAASQADFKTQLVKIKSLNVDAIVLISQLPEGARFITQKQEMGMPQPIFGSEALKDQKLIDSIPVQSRDTVQLISLGQYNGNEAQEFAKNFEEKYSSKPGAYGDYVYDNMLMFAAAQKDCTAQVDNECVKKNLYSLSQTGATGIVKFDANGDVTNKPYHIYRIENNSFEIRDE